LNCSYYNIDYKTRYGYYNTINVNIYTYINNKSDIDDIRYIRIAIKNIILNRYCAKIIYFKLRKYYFFKLMNILNIIKKNDYIVGDTI